MNKQKWLAGTDAGYCAVQVHYPVSGNFQEQYLRQSWSATTLKSTTAAGTAVLML